ncbi:G-type lectin S-receptor-like serine/threonine-protein kinase At4g27290 [Salvia hispanica]|uniref:G-type lectin S-receptor-like serine/threonine-protein kinase At4g27290 n=1 Tax=Salvia hispanica TaxID=49212 RepID=UPI0020096CD6|nr:G-type lectin S-receptor-like serine/threonine-protein kinase At4g27290 [Salvia hispanica]
MKEIWKSFLAILFIHTILHAANDSINISESIRDEETLVSSGGMFALGFFSPGNSRNWYLGIWYNNIPNQTVVWVANRGAPLTNKTGVLTLTEAGTLCLVNETNGLIWSTNASRTVQNPTAQLLDSGNLVVKDADDDDDRPENFLWHSFDHPTDTYIPGMKMGSDLIRGEERYMSSWWSDDDPAPCKFRTHMDLSGYPQIFTEGGRGVRYRYGPWNGVQFSGIAYTVTDAASIRVTIEMNSNRVMHSEYVVQSSVVTRLTLYPDGNGVRWTWNEGNQAWRIYYRFPIDICDDYNKCGAYGSCNVAESPRVNASTNLSPRIRGARVERIGQVDVLGGFRNSTAGMMCS